MNSFVFLCRPIATLIFAFFIMAPKAIPLTAQEQVGVTEVTPNVLVFATSNGNVVASVGPDGALLVGTPSAASTSYVNGIIGQHTKSPVRYVVIFPSSAAKSEGDAGWGKLGAVVAMHENTLRRMGGAKMGAPQTMPGQPAELGVERPHIAFSEVIAFDLNGDSIHIVHQKPGYSDADAVTHFHVANVFYLGEVFPGDGYPSIDSTQGGGLEGLLGQLVWTNAKQHVIPARGKPVTGTDLQAFRDMIVAVRDRIQRLINEGRTESEAVAGHPTADFDSAFGHGRVSPDNFVREIYAALTPAKK